MVVDVSVNVTIIHIGGINQVTTRFVWSSPWQDSTTWCLQTYFTPSRLDDFETLKRLQQSKDGYLSFFSTPEKNFYICIIRKKKNHTVIDT